MTTKNPRRLTKEDRDIWGKINTPLEDHFFELAINDRSARIRAQTLKQHETFAEDVRASINAVTAIPELAESPWSIY